MVIFSYLGLALSGMILKFSCAGWAKPPVRLMGGFEEAGLFHCFCAVLTFTCFGPHLWDLLRRRRPSGRAWRELVGSVKWFP